LTPSRRRWLTAGLAAGFAALGAWVAWRRFSPSAATDDAVALMYGQTLPDHAGQAYDLGQLRGRTVVLNFWATWCPPCIEEMPELAELHLEIASRNATVIGIGVDSAANVREFAEKHRFPYPLLVAGMGGTELARQFGNTIGALPFTAVIDPRGRIVERKLGRIRIDALRAVVRQTLQSG
jgi:peroxiredoxin